MKRKFILAGLVLVIVSFYVGKCSHKTEESDFKDTIAPKIERIYIKNDSLLRINDSIDLRIIEIEKTYEKTVNNILRNNPSDDYNFFSTYIERYRGQYNTDSTQDCESDIR